MTTSVIFENAKLVVYLHLTLRERESKILFMAENNTDTDGRNEAEPPVRVMVGNGVWEKARFAMQDSPEWNRLLSVDKKKLEGTYTVMRVVKQTEDMQQSGLGDGEAKPTEKITYYLYDTDPWSDQPIDENTEIGVVYETHLTGAIVANEDNEFTFKNPSVDDQTTSEDERRLVGTNGRITQNLVNGYLTTNLTFERVTPSPLDPDHPSTTVQLSQPPKVAG